MQDRGLATDMVDGTHIPAARQQQIEAADTSTLETWSLRVLEATSLDEVLRTH